MSIDKKYYVIAGYDLTKLKTDKYKDWKWTDEGSNFTSYQTKGRIQLFDDPMDGMYLYLGYILACGDEYDFNTTKVNLNEVARQKPYVREKLRQLVDNNVINNIISNKNVTHDIYEENILQYEIIIFEECT